MRTPYHNTTTSASHLTNRRFKLLIRVLEMKYPTPTFCLPPGSASGEIKARFIIETMNEPTASLPALPTFLPRGIPVAPFSMQKILTKAIRVTWHQ